MNTTIEIASIAALVAILAWVRVKKKQGPVATKPPLKWMVPTKNRIEFAEKFDCWRNALAKQKSARLQAVHFWQFVEGLFPMELRREQSGRTMTIIWENSTPYVQFDDK